MTQRHLKIKKMKEREDEAMAKRKEYDGMAYVEPMSYFSEDTRRKFKLGEFADKENDEDEEELDEE